MNFDFDKMTVPDLESLIDRAREEIANRKVSARDRLKQEIEDKLKAEQKRLIAGAVKSQGKLSAEEKARRDRLSGQLTELKTQRERVHDAIMAHHVMRHAKCICLRRFRHHRTECLFNPTCHRPCFVSNPNWNTLSIALTGSH